MGTSGLPALKFKRSLQQSRKESLSVTSASPRRGSGVHIYKWLTYGNGGRPSWQLLGPGVREVGLRPSTPHWADAWCLGWEDC